jgi:hypothetical protein
VFLSRLDFLLAGDRLITDLVRLTFGVGAFAEEVEREAGSEPGILRCCPALSLAPDVSQHGNWATFAEGGQR